MNIALGIGRINSAHETDISNNEENEVYVIFKHKYQNFICILFYGF